MLYILHYLDTIRCPDEMAVVYCQVDPIAMTTTPVRAGEIVWC